jgi:hypothetical protein
MANSAVSQLGAPGTSTAVPLPRSYRSAAQDRAAVGARSQAVLGPLQRLQPARELPGDRLVGLLQGPPVGAVGEVLGTLSAGAARSWSASTAVRSRSSRWRSSRRRACARSSCISCISLRWCPRSGPGIGVQISGRDRLAHSRTGPRGGFLEPRPARQPRTARPQSPARQRSQAWRTRESLEVPSPCMRSRRHPTSHAIDRSAFQPWRRGPGESSANGLLIIVAARRGGRWQFVSFSNTPTRGWNPK